MTYGHIVLFAVKPGVGEDEVDQACRPLQELGDGHLEAWSPGRSHGRLTDARGVPSSKSRPSRTEGRLSASEPATRFAGRANRWGASLTGLSVTTRHEARAAHSQGADLFLAAVELISSDLDCPTSGHASEDRKHDVARDEGEEWCREQEDEQCAE